MYFNISSLFFADFRDHFSEHGFHWGEESHLVDSINMTQVFQARIHTEDGCGGLVGLCLSVEWDARSQVELQQWADNASPEEIIPDEFTIPLEFEVALPLLDSPPDLLSMWMELLNRFDDSPLRVDVSGFDYMETPTETAKRGMSIVARADVPLNSLFIAEDSTDGHEDATPFTMCRVITDLHDFCASLSARIGKWHPTTQA